MFLPVFQPFTLALIFILDKSRLVCGRSSDICDWVGSGLHPDVPRGVQPLYLRCTEGHIKWQYPRRALRVLLTPPLAKFQGCVRISKHSTGARLYLEGEKRLYPLYRPVPDGGGKESEPLYRCFTSRRGQVALYLEADPPVDILRKDVVEFSYDIVKREDLADDMEECRPCTNDEILRSFCTSDFVIQGTVSSLTHNDSTQQSELTVLSTKIKRGSPLGQWDNTKYVTLYRPLKCGTKAGRGEFVFFGRYRLGLPVIVCAPRLVHWKELRRKALLERTNQCQLDFE